MNTTALRIEILTIGFQVAVCLLYFFSPKIIFFVNSLNADQIKLITGLVAPATLVLLAFCYTVGAVIDGLTAFVGDGIPPARVEDVCDDSSSSKIRLKYPDAFQELVRSDFELRLLRSTAFNAGLFTLVAFHNSHWVIFGIFLSAFILGGLSWNRRRKRIDKRRRNLIKAAKELIRAGELDDKE